MTSEARQKIFSDHSTHSTMPRTPLPHQKHIDAPLTPRTPSGIRMTMRTSGRDRAVFSWEVAQGPDVANGMGSTSCSFEEDLLAGDLPAPGDLSYDLVDTD